MSDGANPAHDFAVPATDTDLVGVRAVYVGGTGTLVVMRPGGANVSFVGVPAGAILPIRVRQIVSAGTTATNIVALF